MLYIKSSKYSNVIQTNLTSLTKTKEKMRYNSIALVTVSLAAVQGATSKPSIANDILDSEHMQLDPESFKFRLTSRSGNNATWEGIVKRKRAVRSSLLPSEWSLEPPSNGTTFSPREVVVNSGLLSAEELDWTNTETYDATATAQRIANGSVTAEQIVTAFCKRATAVHSLANSLTEINFNQAIERAKELDRLFKETGAVVGPLHGVPITIKDSQDLEGFDATEGLTPLADKPASSNGDIVQILLDAGAVVIAKTNMPQTGLAADSNSILWGRTLNAYNNKFGAGGSTGGEGVAMSTGSSLLGVGTDGAGSCRMPALANGVIGYRASGYRLPSGGSRDLTSSPGRSGIVMSGPVAGNGLFGHSVRDIRAVCKLMSAAKLWEKHTVFTYPSPWMNIEAPRSPRIGVWDVESPNTFIHLFPPVLRGYKAAQERLSAAGYELVKFTPPDLGLIWELYKEFSVFQGIEKIVELISQEPITKIVRDTGIFVPNTPRFPVGVETLYDLNTRMVNITMTMDKSWNADGTPLDALQRAHQPCRR